jgi:hypothetical protein
LPSYRASLPVHWVALQHAAEDAVRAGAAMYGYDFTIIRTGRLRGGGGEFGLGQAYYDTNVNFQEVRLAGMYAGGGHSFSLGGGGMGNGHVLVCVCMCCGFGEEGLAALARPLRVRQHAKPANVTEHPVGSQALEDQLFDMDHRGFTVAFEDRIDGPTSRILAADSIVKVGVWDQALLEY